MATVSDLFDLGIGLHGWIALGLTVAGVVGLHIGLMLLTLKRWDPDADRPGAPPGDGAARARPRNNQPPDDRWSPP